MDEIWEINIYVATVSIAVERKFGSKWSMEDVCV